MFYSHEILTSRKYGVATVWLVATLGSKSNTKKVSRKAILDVDLQKACETIIEAEAPMALRLQSNLLYGVTRVYTQKWDYLLSDTQTIQAGIRTLLNASKSNQIDKNAGKARPDQLILADDPAFLVDEFLEPPPIEFDSILHGNSLHSSQSVLSIRERSCSLRSDHKDSPLGLDLPSSSNGSMGSNFLPIHDPFEGTSSITRSIDMDKINNNDEQMLLQNDDLFEIDDNGEIRELPGIGRELSDLENLYRKFYPESDSAANRGVGRKQQNAIRNHQEINLKLKTGDDTRSYVSDNLFTNDKAEIFDGNDTSGRLIDGEIEGVSLFSLEALQKHKKARSKKNVIITDNLTELGSSDINQMTVDYCANMAAQALNKSRVKMKLACKKKAFYFVYGAGINKVGHSADQSPTIFPLASFSGETLKARILGHLTEVCLNEKKRTRSGVEQNEGDTPLNKRSRNDSLDLDHHHSSNDDDEIIIPIYSHNGSYGSDLQDKSMEIGREVASDLPDHPVSSSLMPWNTTASGNISRTRSSLQQRHGSRITSASPLMGRGSTLPKDLSNDVFLDDKDDMIIYDKFETEFKDIKEVEYDNLHSIFDTRFTAPSIHSSPKKSRHSPVSHDVENDIFETAMSAYTKTTGNSQWAREELDRESYNFLEFLQEKMTEINPTIDSETNPNHARISFTQLFTPEQNAPNISAQAFYHVLSLANKNMIHVQQFGIHDGFIGGDIYISIF